MRDSEDWTGKLLTPQEQNEFLDRWSNVRGGWYFFAIATGGSILAFLIVWIFNA